MRSRAEADSARGTLSDRLLLPGLMLLSTVPLWFSPIPPLNDLLGHMGRYHVELDLAHSPALQRNWDFHWRLIGNLGVDLLVAPLAALVGLERAVWLVALALPPLMIWGMGRISRALHGATTPFVIMAAPFALAFPYQHGFVNYWLACALAFHIFASWAGGKAFPKPARAALFATAAGLIWLAHAYGWAVLVVLVTAFELSRAWSPAPSRWPAMATAILRRMWPVLLPAVLMIAWRNGGAHAPTEGFLDLQEKLRGLLRTLRDQNVWLDQFSLILALALLYFGLRDRRTHVHPALVVAAGAFFMLIILMPAQMLGSEYADTRLWPIVLIVGLLAIMPADRAWRGWPFIAAAALAVFVVRIAAMTAGFAAYEQSYAQHLRALDQVPQGSRIVVLVDAPTCGGWRLERLAHLGSLAIVRRDAFVNSQWRIPGAQLLTPLGGRGTAFESDPSQYVRTTEECASPVGPALTRKIRQIPRDRFQYLWLLGVQVEGAQPGLTPLYADGGSALYALSKEGS